MLGFGEQTCHLCLGDMKVSKRLYFLLAGNKQASLRIENFEIGKASGSIAIAGQAKRLIG